MKKAVISAVFILISLFFAVPASAQFDRVLSEIISEHEKNEVVYADELNFENRSSLFVVILKNNKAECRVYDDADGIQLTDTLTLSLSARLSVAENDGKSYVMSGTNAFYTLQNDSFVRAERIAYDSITPIAEMKNGRVMLLADKNSVLDCLNRLKEKTVSEYPFENILASLDETEITAIKTTLSACADLMSFDINNYDYDTIFKYVLFTHQNFKILTDLDPMTGSSSSLGYNNVSLVSSAFIDYVMDNVLHVPPEKPPVNNLLTRGFCYSGGYYYYNISFDVFFSTAVKELTSVYDLGEGTVFVVFSDVYTEGDTKTDEYSFAILRNTDGRYSLLRLGMGESLPSADEVRKYSPLFGDTKTDSGDIKIEGTSDRLMLIGLLIIISIGIIGFVLAITALIRTKRR